MALAHRSSTRIVALSAFVLLATLSSCAVEEEGRSEDTAELEIELGRHLFYERRLSLEGNRSCGICHEPALGFTDGFVRAVGTTNELHPRNTLTLTNVGARESLTWLQAAPDTLEEQLLVPLLAEHPVEMGMSGQLDDVLADFRSDPVYASLFPGAFPQDADPFTRDRLAEAISAFERTLVSATSPFDRHMGGDISALDEAEQRGLSLFFSHRLRCSRCHAGPDLDQPSEGNEITGRHGWFNVGLYDVVGQGSYPSGGQGLYEETGQPEDMGRFRVPTLRNVELTAPYYHDGSGASLADVIANYATGGRHVTSGPNPGDGRANPYKSDLVNGFVIDEQEADDLEAFLRALTDMEMIENPAFGDPWPRDANGL